MINILIGGEGILDVSFIIPVYNTPLEKLEKCLNSIFDIKELAYEVIIVDDGSDNEIGEFCKLYLKDYSHYKYIYTENAGVSSARNKGIEVAGGVYIAFVDSDDTIVPDVFTKEILDINADLIIFDMAFHCANGIITWEAFLNFAGGVIDYSDVIKGVFSSDRLNSPCAKLFRKKIIKKENIQFNVSMKFAEDEDFVLSFMKSNPRVYYLKEIAYLYCRMEESGKKRLMLYPDIIVDNLIDIHVKEKFMLELLQLDKLDLDNYNVMIEQKTVRATFNIVSDLMIIDKLNDELKGRLLTSIRNISKSSILMFPKKLRFEYFLLVKKLWIPIYIISKLREIYLKIIGIY